MSVVPVLSALADPIRHAIVELLASGPMAVKEIARHFPVSRPAISKHLLLMEEAGVVAAEKRGRERVYRLEPGALEGLAGWLAGLGGTAAMPRSSRRRSPRSPEAAVPASPSRPRARPRPEAATGTALETDGDWRVW